MPRAAQMLVIAVLFSLPLCAVRAQQLPDAPPTPQSQPAAPLRQPLIVPRNTMQPDPHVAEVKVDDPPCLSPVESESYTYSCGTSGCANEAMKEYMWDAKKSIYDHWLIHMPRMAQKPWNKKGTVGVKVTIHKDGAVDPLFVSLSSGRQDLDDHAVESLQQVSPLHMLPNGVSVVHTCFFFYYNMQASKVPEKKQPYDDWLNKPAATPPTR